MAKSPHHQLPVSPVGSWWATPLCQQDREIFARVVAVRTDELVRLEKAADQASISMATHRDPGQGPSSEEPDA